MSHLVSSKAREIRFESLMGFLSSDSGKEIVLIDSPSLLDFSAIRVDFKRFLAEMKCGTSTRVLVYNVFGDVAKSWNAYGASTINVPNVDILAYELRRFKCTVTIVTSSDDAIRFASRLLKPARLIFVAPAKAFKSKGARYIDAAEIVERCTTESTEPTETTESTEATEATEPTETTESTETTETDDVSV